MDGNELRMLLMSAPKSELHVHIEGTMEPEMVIACARRNNITLPYKTPDELKKRYHFSCLQDF